MFRNISLKSAAVGGMVGLILATVPLAASADLAASITRFSGVFAPIKSMLGDFAYVGGVFFLIMFAILVRGYAKAQDDNPKRAIGIAVTLIAGIWLLYLPSSGQEAGDQMFSNAQRSGTNQLP